MELFAAIAKMARMYVEWLRAKLKERGRGSQKRLAEHLGVEQSAITRILNNGGRQIRADELPRMAEFFGENPPQPELDESPRLVPIMGFVGAGAEINPDFEQVPAEGLKTVDLPFPVPEGLIGFEVTGDSMRPRYDEGDVVLCWRETTRGIETFLGEELAVRTDDDRRFLKRVVPGSRKGTFDLESWNFTPTIKGVRLEWFSEIYLTVRAGQFRRFERHPLKKRKA
jgi:phage repressor protein C with HTH and peptisase S24 domain